MNSLKHIIITVTAFQNWEKKMYGEHHNFYIIFKDLLGSKWQHGWPLDLGLIFISLREDLASYKPLDVSQTLLICQCATALLQCCGWSGQSKWCPGQLTHCPHHRTGSRFTSLKSKQPCLQWKSHQYTIYVWSSF